MRWFKHDTDMHTNLKVQQLLDKHSVEGYGIWCLCLEFLGKEGKRSKLMVGKRWQQGLLKVTGWSDESRLNIILETLAELKLINPKAFRYGNLQIPEFGKRADDYTRRQVRTESAQASNSPLILSFINKERINKYINTFKDIHIQVTGVPYIPNYGKDRILLRELLEFKDEDVLSLITEFFNCTSKDWWADKLSIGVFKTVIPQLIARLRK